jgi:hypothetical protein
MRLFGIGKQTKGTSNGVLQVLYKKTRQLFENKNEEEREKLPLHSA